MIQKNDRLDKKKARHNKMEEKIEIHSYEKIDKIDYNTTNVYSLRQCKGYKLV